MDHVTARRAVWGLGAYSALRQVADVSQTLAINWYLAASTGSAGLLGFAWVASRLPWVVLPFSGFAADRLARRRMIVAGDVVLAAIGVAVIVLRPVRTAALLFLAVYAVGYAAVRPATKGLPREVAGTSEGAARLSGVMTTLEYVAILVAQVAAGRWLLPRGPVLGLGVMAATLVLGAVVLLRTVPVTPSPLPPAARGLREVTGMLWAPELRGPLVLTVICGGCAFVLLPLAPLLAHGGPALYGLLMAAYSLGAAGGSALARWTEGWRSGMRGAALAWLIAVPALALAPRADAVVAVIGCYGAVGLAAGFQDASNAARLAALIPHGAQSQAMALGSLVWRLPGVVAGTLVAGTAPLHPAVLCLALAGVLAVVAVVGALATPGVPQATVSPPAACSVAFLAGGGVGYRGVGGYRAVSRMQLGGWERR